MRYFHIHAKLNCDYCKKAINLLVEEEFPFLVTMWDRCPEMENATKHLFGWQTVPLIIEVIGEQAYRVGGFTELERYVKDGKKKNSFKDYYEAARKNKKEEEEKDAATERTT